MKTIYQDEIPAARKNLDLYFMSVRMDHRAGITRAGFSLYAWFWFHTEFWLEPLARRPYTFIFRDWIFTHLIEYGIIISFWYAGMLTWLYWSPYPSGVLIGLSSWLNAHLVWGGKWNRGEQEWPPYLGE